MGTFTYISRSVFRVPCSKKLWSSYPGSLHTFPIPCGTLSPFFLPPHLAFLLGTIWTHPPLWHLPPITLEHSVPHSFRSPCSIFFLFLSSFGSCWQLHLMAPPFPDTWLDTIYVPLTFHEQEFSGRNLPVAKKRPLVFRSSNGPYFSIRAHFMLFR